jgi:hypothetical protein
MWKKLKAWWKRRWEFHCLWCGKPTKSGFCCDDPECIDKHSMTY